jgi:hypothetical protein
MRSCAPGGGRSIAAFNTIRQPTPRARRRPAARAASAARLRERFLDGVRSRLWGANHRESKPQEPAVADCVELLDLLHRSTLDRRLGHLT